jgi:hypothetical protein
MVDDYQRHHLSSSIVRFLMAIGVVFFRCPSRYTHSLNIFGRHCVCQQPSTSLALDRLVELETVDDPIVTSMETMCYEIELIASECAPNDKATTSSTITIAKNFVSLSKIQLPRFNGSILHWRSFLDTCVSLVHDNPTIGDAKRFHYLLSCLSGSALGLIPYHCRRIVIKSRGKIY